MSDISCAIGKFHHENDSHRTVGRRSKISLITHMLPGRIIVKYRSKAILLVESKGRMQWKQIFQLSDSKAST